MIPDSGALRERAVSFIAISIERTRAEKSFACKIHIANKISRLNFCLSRFARNGLQHIAATSNNHEERNAATLGI